VVLAGMVTAASIYGGVRFVRRRYAP